MAGMGPGWSYSAHQYRILGMGGIYMSLVLLGDLVSRFVGSLGLPTKTWSHTQLETN